MARIEVFRHVALASAAYLAVACDSAASVGAAASDDASIVGSSDAASPILDAGSATSPRPGADSGSGMLSGSHDEAGAAKACVGTIYLIGQDTGSSPDMSQPVVLYAFAPSTLTLTRIGAIPCISPADEFAGTSTECSHPTTGGCTAAMTVDDAGVAWIFTPWLADGATPQKIFGVHTSDATCAGQGVTVVSSGLGVVGATYVAHPDGGNTTASPGIFVSVEEETSPSGTLTIGQIDTQTGVITGVAPVSSAIGPLVDANWYAVGGMATMPEGWLMLQDWLSPGNGASIIGVDPACMAGGCANGAPGGSAAAGTPTWAMAFTAFPASLTFPAQPWTAIWAPYFFATTTNTQYYNDVYYFAPGWWAGSRAVTQLDLNNGLSLAEATPDVGANVFAATAGPPCPPAAVAPPPPPLK